MRWVHWWLERRQLRQWVTERDRRRKWLDELAADVEPADPERAKAIRRLRASPIIEPELNPVGRICTDRAR
jgi:hypothetical protein